MPPWFLPGSRDRCFSSQTAFGKRCCGRTVSCSYDRQFLTMKWNNPSGRKLCLRPSLESGRFPNETLVTPASAASLNGLLTRQDMFTSSQSLRSPPNKSAGFCSYRLPKDLISSRLNTTGTRCWLPRPFFRHTSRSRHRTAAKYDPERQSSSSGGGIVASGPRPSCPPQ